MKPTHASRLICAYIKMRDALDAREKQNKEFKKAIEADMHKVELALMKVLNDQKLDSIKGEKGAGTAFKTTKDFVGIEDFDSFLGFLSNSIVDALDLESYGFHLDRDELAGLIVENADWHFFNKAVNKQAVKDYMKENNDKLPPGLKYSSEVVVQIRR